MASMNILVSVVLCLSPDFACDIALNISWPNISCDLVPKCIPLQQVLLHIQFTCLPKDYCLKDHLVDILCAWILNGKHK
jgi:hypothetical protein